jgi:hypothetical protein
MPERFTSITIHIFFNFWNITTKRAVDFLLLTTPSTETSRMKDMFALCHVPIPLFIFFNHTDKTQLFAILYGSGVKVRVQVFLINIKVKVHLY